MYPVDEVLSLPLELAVARMGLSRARGCSCRRSSPRTYFLVAPLLLVEWLLLSQATPLLPLKRLHRRPTLVSLE